MACVDWNDNELVTLETIHHFVEILDKYFGNVRCTTSLRHCTRYSCRGGGWLQVCELDLIFNFHKVLSRVPPVRWLLSSVHR